MKGYPQLSEELRLIPLPAKILAALLPLCVILLVGLPSIMLSGPVRPRLSVLILVAGLGSVLFGIWVLLVGYVYADAKRRGMSRGLWMLVVIFVPNALGFILYFLLRHPILSDCPDCGHILEPGVGYCPHCGRQVGRSCPHCSRSVSVADAYCSGCGQKLEIAIEQPG